MKHEKQKTTCENEHKHMKKNEKRKKKEKHKNRRMENGKWKKIHETWKQTSIFRINWYIEIALLLNTSFDFNDIICKSDDSGWWWRSLPLTRVTPPSSLSLWILFPPVFVNKRPLSTEGKQIKLSSSPPYNSESL